jgi:hypothetical protein
MNKMLKKHIDELENSIHSEFERMEQFREENFPEELPLNCNLSINIDDLPILKQIISVNIPKSPGIFKKLIFRTNDDLIWKEQTIDIIYQNAKSLLNTYQTYLNLWVKEKNKDVEEIKRELEASAKKSAESAQNRLNIYKQVKIHNVAEKKSIVDNLKGKMQELNNRYKLIMKYKNEWSEIKEKTILSAFVE